MAAPERHPVQRTIALVGTLEGWVDVMVGSERGGRVLKVHHDMGDRIKPGEELVEVETVGGETEVIRAPPPRDGGAPSYAVIRRLASAGQVLRQGEAAIELVVEDPLWLSVHVPERYRSEIQLGQPVRFNVVSHPAAVFDGEVTQISPVDNPATRTFLVKAAVPNADRRLRPGNYARVSIVTQRNEGLRPPTSRQPWLPVEPDPPVPK